MDYQEIEDRQLIHLVASLDKDALEALYVRYSTSVYSLAMYMLRNEALAEEVTQEIFLNVWLKASSFKPDRGGPRSWLMSVAHHKVVDLIRSRRRSTTMSDPADYETLDLLPSKLISTEEQVEQNLDRQRIMAAMSTLPEAQREVILMAYFQGSNTEFRHKREGKPQQRPVNCP